MSEVASPDTSPSAESAPAHSRKFTLNFWVINTIEMFERLAYNTYSTMLPIYVAQADDVGGLHLTAKDRGSIILCWSLVSIILPIITGGLADRFGYKKTLTFGISGVVVAYLLFAFLRDIGWLTSLFASGLSPVDFGGSEAAMMVEATAKANFWCFLFSILVLAIGGSFFKPAIQGALGNTLTKENSSLGWGLFYWVVNVGAFIAHYLPNIILVAVAVKFGLGEHSPEAWRNLFLTCAGVATFKLMFMLICFKDVPTGASQSEPLVSVLRRTVVNIFEPRLLCWIVIMSGFWMMMLQLWDSQPNFIADWVSSAHVAEWIVQHAPEWITGLVVAGKAAVVATEAAPAVAATYHIPQQIWLSINSLCIIIGVIPMAWATRKMKTLSAMLIGMVAVTAGLLIAGLTMNVGILAIGVIFFSIGEMTVGPKKSEYLSLIAPPGKKALYLGYINIPAGIGRGLGAWLSGFLYANYSEKATLALRYLAEKTDFAQGREWAGGSVQELQTFLGVTRPEAMEALTKHLGIDAPAATQILWDTYNPQLHLWIPFASIGVLSGIALFIYARMARRWKDMDA